MLLLFMSRSRRLWEDGEGVLRTGGGRAVAGSLKAMCVEMGSWGEGLICR